MDFISTPAALSTPPETSILQTVSVRMDSREVPPIVHLTQYDQTLPVVAVTAWYNGQPYRIPDGAAVNIRMSKPDGTHVYDPALGLSEDRLTAYIAVTAQMTAAKGEGRAILEVVLDGGIAGTAPINFQIDKNPVPAEAYESSDEYKTIYELVQEVTAKAEAAAESERLAGEHEEAAGEHMQAAAGSAEASEQSRRAADDAAEAAARSETNAADSEQAAARSAERAAASETAAGESADAAGKSAAEAENWSNTSKSWAIGEGLGEKRPDEGRDNAKYYAAQAAASAGSAAGSVQVIEDNAEALQTVRDNLAGILAAPDAADRAEAAADSAGLDAERAEEAANRAQSIAQGAKGYYEAPEDLRDSVPEGKPGDWAIVGSTDTIWVWDKETGDWKDSHQATDLSNYYTKNQADEENNKLLAQITQETDEKLAEKLGKAENAVSASKLSPGASINGVPFDGSEPITVADGTKVAKTGDTMTGDLTLSGDTRAIKYQNSDLTAAPISFYKGDSSGVGIVIGGGGRTIIGGGEAAASLHSALPANESAEELHLGGDGNVYVHTNCQTVASRKTFTFGTDGKLTAPNGFAGIPTLALSLPVASWSASNTLSVTATGVTASNTVIVTPAPASFEAWGESMVRCTAQGANSLTFTASDKPTVALTAQVLILN